jgi:hypothetical protein
MIFLGCQPSEQACLLKIDQNQTDLMSLTRASAFRSGILVLIATAIAVTDVFSGISGHPTGWIAPFVALVLGADFFGWCLTSLK